MRPQGIAALVLLSIVLLASACGASALADRYAGWQTYSNPDYAFSFRYPPDWTVQLNETEPSTSYRHSLRIASENYPGVALTVGFKYVWEDYGILRTGVGQGDIVVQGKVSFLGEDVDRQVLVWQGKHTTVMYHTAETVRGDMAFTVDLDAFGEGAALTPEVESIADRIVASFDMR